MFVLFTSDATERYIRDALEVLCYPEGHIIRFRYDQAYVSKSIQEKAATEEGLINLGWRSNKRRALIAFLEQKKNSEKKPERRSQFRIFPLREVNICQIQRIGSVYYVDFSLGGYVSYNPNATRSDDRKIHIETYCTAVQNQFETLPNRPLPPVQDGEGLGWNNKDELVNYEHGKGYHGGYFFYEISNKTTFPITYSINLRTEQQAWESIVDALARSTTLCRANLFRISGFFTTNISGCWPWRRFLENRILPKTHGLHVEYRLPMGQAVYLKILSYKSKLSDVSSATPTFSITADGDAFGGVSPRIIHLSSRYNEDRITLACRRVVDHVLTSVRLNETTNGALETTSETLSPHVFLLTRVVVPSWLGPGLFLLFMLGTFLLSISPEFLQTTGYIWAIQSKSLISIIARVFGATSLALAAYIAFRKLPTGK